jgi:putative transposase
LLIASPAGPGGPVVLVWDGLNTHLSRAMRKLAAALGWLTVFQLPPCASELNPVETACTQFSAYHGYQVSESLF